MATIGFTTYVQPAPPTQPTLAERFAELSGAQKIDVLNGFSSKTLANRLKRDIGLQLDLIIGIYREIDEIEEMSRALMRGEVVLVEEERDPETGEVIVEEVRLEAPTTISDLKDQVAINFVDIFTVQEVGAVIDRMILYSELDEDGTPIGTQAVYAAEVIK